MSSTYPNWARQSSDEFSALLTSRGAMSFLPGSERSLLGMVATLPRPWRTASRNRRASPSTKDSSETHSGMCLAHHQQYTNGSRPYQSPCGTDSDTWYIYPLDQTPGSQRYQV